MNTHLLPHLARQMLRIGVVLVLMAAISSLAACGGGDPEDFEAEAGPDTPAPTTPDRARSS